MNFNWPPEGLRQGEHLEGLWGVLLGQTWVLLGREGMAYHLGDLLGMSI